MTTRKKIEPGWILIPVVMGILIFAAVTWISTPDSYTDAHGITHTITGWEVIKASKPNFFTWVWIGLFGTLIFGFLAYANESGNTAIGKKLRGYTWVTILLVVLAFVCLIVPWIPALSAKTEGGIFLKQSPPQSSRYDKTDRTISDAGLVCSITDSSNGILSKG